MNFCRFHSFKFLSSGREIMIMAIIGELALHELTVPDGFEQIEFYSKDTRTFLLLVTYPSRVHNVFL